MALSVHNGDLQVSGHFHATTMTVAANAVADAQVVSNAAIQATKLVHEVSERYSQNVTANAAADAQIIYVARAAGTLKSFRVGLVTAPDTAVGSSGRTATFDLKKNGTTVLSSTVTLNSTNVAYIVVNGTISVPTYAAGDVFTVHVTVGGSAGTHALGVFAQANFHEPGAA